MGKKKKKSLHPYLDGYRLSINGSPLLRTYRPTLVYLVCSPKPSGRLSQALPEPQSLAPHGFGVLLWPIRRFLAPTGPTNPPQDIHPSPPNPNIAIPYRIRVGGGPALPTTVARNRKREGDQLVVFFFYFFFYGFSFGRCLPMQGPVGWSSMRPERSIQLSPFFRGYRSTRTFLHFFFSLSGGDCHTLVRKMPCQNTVVPIVKGEKCLTCGWHRRRHRQCDEGGDLDAGVAVIMTTVNYTFGLEAVGDRWVSVLVHIVKKEREGEEKRRLRGYSTR